MLSNERPPTLIAKRIRHEAATARLMPIALHAESFPVSAAGA
jgi:hypothetical protein